MTKSVAKHDLNVQVNALVDEVFQAQRKTFRNAARQLLMGFCVLGTPLVSRLCTLLKDSGTNLKGRQERISRWLDNHDFASLIDAWLLHENATHVTNDTQINIDLTDISKEWGGKGLEGMELGWDASTKTKRYGHTVGSAIIPGTTPSDPIKPLIFKLYKGRKNSIAHLTELCDTVLDATGGKGILVIDREGDCEMLIRHLLLRNARFVIRVKHLKRDVFPGDKNTPAHLNSAPGTWKRKGMISLDDGTSLYVIRQNPIEEEREKGYKSLFLYTNIPQLNQAIARYKLRWAVETFHRDIKQFFDLEDVLVRTFKRLRSIVALTILSYHLLANRLRQASFFGQLLKTIQKNIGKTIHQTNRFRTVIKEFRELLLHGHTPGGRPSIRRHDHNQLNFLALLR